MAGYMANFVVRVRGKEGNLRVSVHNLKTGEKKEFSSWPALWGWLEQQARLEGLR
jgi:hypothetical protein